MQRVRDALNAGNSCTELVLNYRRDGQSFWCLLNIIPLRDSTGQLVYFIGGQTNVTGTLASSKGLSFLIGGGMMSTEAPDTSTNASGFQLSPLMARYMRSSTATNLSAPDLGIGGAGAGGGNGAASSDSHSASAKAKTRRAAGAFDPIESSGPIDDNGMLAVNKKKGGMLDKVFGRKKAADRQGLDGDLGGQRLIGAEATFRAEARTLEEQMQYFSDVYSKILIFKRQKREIIFVTRELLQFFGLPYASPKDLFSSPLIHSDLLSILSGGDRTATKALRATGREAVSAGQGFSITAGVRAIGKSRLFGVGQDNSYSLTKATVHLTPLKVSCREKRERENKDRDELPFLVAIPFTVHAIDSHPMFISP